MIVFSLRILDVYSYTHICPICQLLVVKYKDLKLYITQNIFVLLVVNEIVLPYRDSVKTWMYVCQTVDSGLSINPTFVAKSFGVEFDSALKMDRHVSLVIPLSWTSLPPIKFSSYQTICRCESMWACCPSYCVVSSWLCKFIIVWIYGIKVSQILCLQKIQNCGAKLIYLARKHDHVTTLLKELHWLPIKQRIGPNSQRRFVDKPPFVSTNLLLCFTNQGL